ncbi:hypothetical protein D3C71_791870 [compost metagenome]
MMISFFGLKQRDWITFRIFHGVNRLLGTQIELGLLVCRHDHTWYNRSIDKTFLIEPVFHLLLVRNSEEIESVLVRFTGFQNQTCGR